MPAHFTSVLVACKECGSTFFVTQGRLSVRRYCSQACYHKWTPLNDRFFDSIGKKLPNGCIMWAGTTDDNGYGRISAGGNGGKKILAHRLSYELFNGAIPPGLFVLHRCDTPLCINPAHLFLGTQADNMADMMAKHRHGHGPRQAVRGERNANVKLTAAIVTLIRKRQAAGERLSALAATFGVCAQHIHKIVRRECWKHI